jgi:hypothetical protein
MGWDAGFGGSELQQIESVTMAEFKADPSEGVFDSSEAKNLSEAFEKADEIISRPETPLDSDANRDDLARRIISEALEGETQPDLLSRSAVAKMLIEQLAEAPEELAADAVTKADSRDESPPKRPGNAP